MHTIIWALVLAPPVIAFVVWQGVGRNSRTGEGVPWQRVRLGKYGLWVTLTVCYVAAFGAALLLHKL